MRSERRCDLCERDMPIGSAFWPEMAELSFSVGKHKCVCQDCFMRQPGIGQAVAQLAEQMLRAHARRDIDDPHWVFNRSMARKKDQMSDETQIKNMDPDAKAVEDPYATHFDSTRGFMPQAFIEKAKRQLDHDYPEQSRAKAMVHTKLDEALLWLGKVGALFALLLCCSCGGLAVVRDKLASYNDEIAVFCPQSDISQKCIDARRRAEVSEAAIQTATIGEQLDKDAKNLITQADIVVGAALEWFKTEFLGKQ
jgi:hypothetical protein